MPRASLSSSLSGRAAPSFPAWNALPPAVRLHFYQSYFRDASSTYLFAPGGGITNSRVTITNEEDASAAAIAAAAPAAASQSTNFVITNSSHLNLLYTCKRTWKEGVATYFQTAKIIFRGYERMLHESLPTLPTLRHHVVELNVPLHFVRWMIRRRIEFGGPEHERQAFDSLSKIVMEDMSRTGFTIGEEKKNRRKKNLQQNKASPSTAGAETSISTSISPTERETEDEQEQEHHPTEPEILGSLFKKDTELAQIHALLVAADGRDANTKISDRESFTKGLEVVFEFELFHQNLSSLSSTTANIPTTATASDDKNNAKQMETRAKGVERAEGALNNETLLSSSSSPPPSLSLHTVSDYTLNVRTRELIKTNTRVMIRKGG